MELGGGARNSPAANFTKALRRRRALQRVCGDRHQVCQKKLRIKVRRSYYGFWFISTVRFVSIPTPDNVKLRALECCCDYNSCSCLMPICWKGARSCWITGSWHGVQVSAPSSAPPPHSTYSFCIDQRMMSITSNGALPYSGNLKAKSRGCSILIPVL